MVENIYVCTSAHMCEMATDEKRRLAFAGEQGGGYGCVWKEEREKCN